MTSGRLHLALFLLLAAAGLAVPPPAFAADALDAVLQGTNVQIRYPASARKWADLTLGQVADADAHALETLGLTTNRRVNIHLYMTTSSFQKATSFRVQDTLGVAMPSANLIVIDCSRAELRGPNSLGITLRHEMIHIAVGRLEARTGKEVPLWFNEGVATWSSGRISDADPQALVGAANTDSLIPLHDIADSFPIVRIPRELAYQEGESTVKFLVHDFGHDAVKRIVRLMEDGYDFNQALAKVTGGIDFEAKWRDYVKREYPWYAFLVSFFSLLTVGAFLLIGVYLIYRIRRHRKLREWKEEERIYYGDVDEDDDGAADDDEEDPDMKWREEDQR